MQALARECKVHMILGNHDLFNKNSVEVNSINIFRDISNVEVVDKPSEIEINGKLALMVPWLSDLSQCKEETYDLMFGHFDISSKFLISSYVQEHSRDLQASADVSNEIDADNSLKSSGNTLEDSVGDFIDLAKMDGTVFAGHIHQHKEMISKGRNFIFVGSPYEQNLGEIGSKHGYYILDKACKYSFYEINDVPKHIKIKTSDVIKAGIDEYDFSPAKENIVQKVYDIDVSLEDDMKISQKIASFKPYEELLPDYQVQVAFTSNAGDKKQDKILAALKKSKLDYIDSYINQLDEKALEENKIDKKVLKRIMEKYYKTALVD